MAHADYHTAQLTTMAAENLLINDGCNGQTVETVGERLPQANVETPFA